MTSLSTQSNASISVGELNRQARSLLENSFMTLSVQGEVSNFVAPASGHWYFTLKDSKAQVRCAMFRNRSALLKYRPKNGDKVVVRAKVSLYEGRGDFQLICEYMEEDGFGALEIALDKLKKKLDHEGLFDPAHKKPLPTHPTHIGIITAPTGAAIHDMLTVLNRRCPSMQVSVYPTLVQGDEAALNIARAIALANRHAHCDVLIVGRGGGSKEDLWAFNEEITARAVFASKIPIISAVGHEIDVVVTDLVADMRAPTPSAAAELVSPDQQVLTHKLAQFESRLQLLTKQRLQMAQQKLSTQSARLRHPSDKLNQQMQKVDDLHLRLAQSIQRHLERKASALSLSSKRLSTQHTKDKIHHLQNRVGQLNNRIQSALAKTLERKQLQLAAAAGQLNAVSPLATLDRGYAIVKDENNAVVTDSTSLNVNSNIQVRLHKGQLNAKVVDIDTKPEPIE